MTFEGLCVAVTVGAGTASVVADAVDVITGETTGVCVFPPFMVGDSIIIAAILSGLKWFRIELRYMMLAANHFTTYIVMLFYVVAEYIVLFGRH